MLHVTPLLLLETPVSYLVVWFSKKTNKGGVVVSFRCGRIAGSLCNKGHRLRQLLYIFLYQQKIVRDEFERYYDHENSGLSCNPESEYDKIDALNNMETQF